MSPTFIGVTTLAIIVLVLGLAAMSLRDMSKTAKIITALAALVGSIATLVTALHNFMV